MVWMRDDISAKLSSAIGHWKLAKLEFLADNPLTLGSWVLASPGVASSSLEMDFFAQHADLAVCRLMLTFLHLTTTFSAFFSVLCSIFFVLCA